MTWRDFLTLPHTGMAAPSIPKIIVRAAPGNDRLLLLHRLSKPVLKHARVAIALLPAADHHLAGSVDEEAMLKNSYHDGMVPSDRRASAFRGTETAFCAF